MADIGKELEQARKSLGWSLRQAEQASGVSNGYISQIEREEAEPSPDVLQRLSKAYGIPFEVLMESAGYIMKRTEPSQHKVPAFVFSAAEKMDERDWEAAQAFFQALLAIREQHQEEEVGKRK